MTFAASAARQLLVKIGLSLLVVWFTLGVSDQSDQSDQSDLGDLGDLID